ncbi:TPA: hypothetical protein ACKP1B_000710 [Serratia fonticola]
MAGAVALTLLVSFSSVADTVVQSLAACDASFFNQMKGNKQIDNLIRLANAQPIKEKGNVTLDAKGYRDGDLTLNRYISRYSSIDKTHPGAGEYYFWGFETDEAFDVVVKKVGKQIALLNNNGPYVHSPMIKDSNHSNWTVNKQPNAGSTPGKQTAEKLFFIEKNQDGTASLLCTLQGVFSESDLKTVRPDLN